MQMGVRYSGNAATATSTLLHYRTWTGFPRKMTILPLGRRACPPTCGLVPLAQTGGDNNPQWEEGLPVLKGLRKCAPRQGSRGSSPSHVGTRRDTSECSSENAPALAGDWPTQVKDGSHGSQDKVHKSVAPPHFPFTAPHPLSSLDPNPGGSHAGPWLSLEGWQPLTTSHTFPDDHGSHP